MSFNVFVSYSWANSAERRALVSELATVPNVKALVDKNDIRPGDPIHQEASRLIEAAHCVVVFLTPDGLASNEVHDELVRCHERSKLIIPVVAEGTPLEALPWFMRDILRIHYSPRTFDAVIETVLERVRELASPLDRYVEGQLPPSLKKLLESGARFVDVGARPSAAGVATDVFCELGMRNSEVVFVFRALAGARVSDVAESLARTLVPDARSGDYDWLLVKDDATSKRRAVGHLTLEMAGIKTGDRVLLLGNHRMPSWAPSGR